MPAESGPRRAFTSPGYLRLIYLLLGQAGWLTGVLSGAHGRGWIGMTFVALLMAGHLMITANRWREAAFAVGVALAGWGWESLVLRTGWVAYPDGAWPAGFAPYWMAGLWALFAMQINPLFSSLRRHWVLASLSGAIGGPLSFRAGAALGAITFVDLPPAMILIACGWAMLLPALLWLGGKVGGAAR